MNISHTTAEQPNSIQRRQELEGQQAVALIQTATQQPKANTPPPQPVQVTPRAGSTVEVVA